MTQLLSLSSFLLSSTFLLQLLSWLLCCEVGLGLIACGLSVCIN